MMSPVVIVSLTDFSLLPQTTMRRKLSAHALCGRCVGASGMLASAPNGDNPWLNCSHSHPLAAKCSSHPREPEKYEAV